MIRIFACTFWFFKCILYCFNLSNSFSFFSHISVYVLFCHIIFSHLFSSNTHWINPISSVSSHKSLWILIVSLVKSICVNFLLSVLTHLSIYAVVNCLVLMLTCYYKVCYVSFVNFNLAMKSHIIMIRLWIAFRNKIITFHFD